MSKKSKKTAAKAAAAKTAARKSAAAKSSANKAPAPKTLSIKSAPAQASGGQLTPTYLASSAAPTLLSTPVTVTITSASIADDGSGQLAGNVTATVALDTRVVDPNGSPIMRVLDEAFQLVAEETLESQGGDVWGKTKFAPGAFQSGKKYQFSIVQDYTFKPFPGTASGSDIVTAP